MKRCAVTGSFDPITYGHLSLLVRATELFDEVFLLMLVNDKKSYTFTTAERQNLAMLAVSTLTKKQKSKIKVCFYGGLTVDFCKEQEIKYLVRGLREASEFEYEREIAAYNKDNGELETLFFIAQNLSSSSEVRNMINEGNYKDLGVLIPQCCSDEIKKLKAIK